jgi:hypothetical protein|tara:strand:- start:1528 stop:1713 length:186 start_codon:yes stop_codon:yes gene_type:complete
LQKRARKPLKYIQNNIFEFKLLHRIEIKEKGVFENVLNRGRCKKEMLSDDDKSREERTYSK